MTSTSPPTTVAGLLEHRSTVHATAPALLASDRAVLDYGTLAAFVTQTGARLNTLGIGRGHRVAMVLPNGPEAAAAFLAVAAHACAAPLNPALGDDEFTFHLRDMRADALLVQRDADEPVAAGAARAVAVARRLGIPVVELTPRRDDPAGVFDLDGEPRHLPADRSVPARPGDTALVLHTSGTTARPKLVPLTQENLNVAAGNTARAFSLGTADRCLNVMPLFHAHGLVSTLLAVVHSGGSVVCTPGFSGDRFFDWLAAYRPTWYSAVPAMHHALLAERAGLPPAEGARGLRFIRSASAPLPGAVREGLETAFGAPVVEAYGMSEAGSLITSNPLPPGKRKPGSVGLPVGEPVAILDRDGRQLARGEVGAIAIRGANVTAGYENAPQANREAFSGDWLRTGDEGRLDEDGYLYITGRTKEIINKGGSKISPAEIDDVMAGHPDVRTAVAFGVPHPTLGEDIALAVVPRPGATVDEGAIRRFAAERLTAHKVPGRVHFVTDVPRTAAGKVRRLELAAALTAPVPDRTGTSPRDRVAAVVAAVWAQVLDRDTVGQDENFFDLGGDSLSLAKVATRLSGALARPVSLVELTMHPTVGSLSAHLARSGTGPEGAAERPAAGPVQSPTAGAAAARDRVLRQRARFDRATNRGAAR